MNTVPLPPPSGWYLGIDPGNFDTAFCFLSGIGTIGYFGKVANEDFRQILLDSLGITKKIGIEMIASFGLVAGASLFETCLEIGRLEQIIEDFGCGDCDLITRNEIKKHICPGVRSNDAIIRAALIEKFGPPGTKKNPGPTYGITADVWSALAIAETTRSGDYKPYVFSNLRPKKPRKPRKPKLETLPLAA